jgi:glycosyltransferase involved in cell wall biosynthesis
LNLAIVSTNLALPWGGSEKPWAHLADCALDAGHRVLAVVSPRVALHPRLQALAARGATIHERSTFTYVPSRGEQVRRLLRPHARWGPLRAALARFRPDLVLLNQGGVFDFLLEDRLLDWCRAQQVGVVPYCHCNSDLWSLTAADRAKALELIPEIRAMLFVSTHNQRVAEHQLAADIPRSKIVQYPAVDWLARQNTPWPNAPGPRCAVVARLDAHHKGIDLLLPALRQAWQAWPDWRLNLYGEGPDRDYLGALATRLGLENQVCFHGFSTDIAAVWAENEILLMPSRHEGCSQTMLEAMACGRPALATDVGGVSDWLEDGISAFICPAPEVAALTNTLRRAAEARSRWQTMGIAAAAAYRTRRDPHPERTLLDFLTKTALC